MSKNCKIRLDELLVKRGLISSLKEAKAYILAKNVKVNGETITNPSFLADIDANICLTNVDKYVSRGGLKLEAALKTFNITVEGKKCLDIGSSTGGFSDCLLKRGAGFVTCVDVNYGQLAWSVRNDDRVSVFERTNIKSASHRKLGAPFDVIVIDVSFIGLASLISTIKKFTYAGTQANSGETELIALVKPQFEAKRDEVAGGVVNDENVRLRTIEEVKSALICEGFSVQGVIESPIKGASKHNIEYLIYATI